MKHLVPFGLKVRLKLVQRHLRDRSTGLSHQFVEFNQLSPEQQKSFQPQITIAQAIYPTSYSESKKHNLAIAIQRVENVLIHPERIFSFWHLIGKPDRSKGYQKGRAILGDELSADVGGGLCQLSGLLYFLSLKAGLIAIERYPHSRDLYTAETRFAPLGSDATVVYGYKDLRIQNNLLFPICFRFNLQDTEITASLCAEQAIPEYRVEFKVEECIGGVKADTIRFANHHQFEIIDSTIYKK
ncbi:VanW family protein [Tumidithrix elongata RA019]|uniref:VanW family protein n=1 Tax=Tumidithrix elongata BACA0141 TaxID=2716417 RepID=A0AAW9PXW2_9CYAN|nr:VanW family protein [Tumidithrix elongata RA019]